MLFLITGEYVEPGSLLSPQDTLNVFEQFAIPSFQMLEQWEKEGKLKGGVHPGERDCAFVLEAESFEELDRMMFSLPFVGLLKWSTQPIMPFASIARQLPEYIQHIRQTMAQAQGTQ